MIEREPRLTTIEMLKLRAGHYAAEEEWNNLIDLRDELYEIVLMCEKDLEKHILNERRTYQRNAL